MKWEHLKWQYFLPEPGDTQEIMFSCNLSSKLTSVRSVKYVACIVISTRIDSLTKAPGQKPPETLTLTLALTLTNWIS